MDDYNIPMAKPDLGKLEEKAILDVFNSGWLGQGKITQEFEEELSKYLDSNAVAVFNGSTAIMCALLAHGIKPGDNVVVPNFTFMSTASVPKILGANIILVDIDLNTLNIDIIELEKILKINKIKFVIFVDIAGLANDIEYLTELSKRYNFILIEDAAEAFGSEYKKKKIGSFEHTTIFSFHIAKIITTIEGGCITSKNEEFVKKLMAIRDIGRKERGYIHHYLGSNFRTTDIQSAIGLQQLKKIEYILERKNNVAASYRDEIKNLEFQQIPSYATLHSYMLFFAIAENENSRNKYVQILRKNGIDSRIPWTPISQQPCFPEFNNSKYRNSEEISKNSFIIPIYNTINEKETKQIIKIINEIGSVLKTIN